MIIAGVFSAVLIDIIRFFISLLPTVNFPEFTFVGTVESVFNVVWYFLPMDTIITLFSLGCVITLVRVVLAIIFRLSAFIGDLH